MTSWRPTPGSTRRTGPRCRPWAFPPWPYPRSTAGRGSPSWSWASSSRKPAAGSRRLRCSPPQFSVPTCSCWPGPRTRSWPISPRWPRESGRWRWRSSTPEGDRDAGSVTTTARTEGDRFVLDGAKSYVVDGHTADVLIVAAREGSSVEADLAFYLVGADTSGVTREPLVTLDLTRKQAAVRLDGVVVDASARLPRGGAGVLDDLYDLAAVRSPSRPLAGPPAAWRCRWPMPRSGSSSADR